MNFNAQTFAKVQTLMKTAALAASANGTGIDTLGFEEMLVTLDPGTGTGAGSMTFTLEESDASGSGYAAITGAAFTAVTTANDDPSTPYLARVKLQQRKRYIRAVATLSGTFSLDRVSVLATLMVPSTTANTSQTYAFSISEP